MTTALLLLDVGRTSSLALYQLTRNHLEINVHPLSVIVSSDITFESRLVLALDTQFDDGLFYFNSYSEQRNGKQRVLALVIQSIETHPRLSGQQKYRRVIAHWQMVSEKMDATRGGDAKFAI